MRRRYLLSGLLGLLALASASGCGNRQLRSGHCCAGSIFPGRARPMLATPVGAAPIGYGAPVGFDGGVGAPGCSSCAGGAGMPIASSAGYPAGYQASMHAPPTYGNAIPHDSMLLPSPTVIPPGVGSPRIVVDPPKPMPMMGK